MKVLITGGSGFLGINLVRSLFDKGIRDIITLDIVDFDYPEKDKVTFVMGDIRDKEIVSKVMKGVDVVIHTAAALPLYTKEQIYSVDIEGTRNLLEEAYKNGVNRFIHISSTAVYGVPDHHPLYEDDKLEGVGYYGIAKVLAEEVCQEYRKKGMCLPIIRPKSFIGPERLGVFAFFYEWAKDGKNFPMLGNGKNRYQLLAVEDLCEAVCRCATHDKTVVNDTFNIGAEKFTTLKEDFQAVLDEAGCGKKILCFPAWPVVAVLRVLEFLRLSPLYMWIYETVDKDSFVSIEKAKTKLGFNPQYSNKDALIRNFKWYLANYKHFEGKTGVSHRVAWKQGALKAAKLFF